MVPTSKRLVAAQNTFAHGHDCVEVERNCNQCGQSFTDMHHRKCPACRAVAAEKKARRHREGPTKILSFRERQIVGLVMAGKPNKEIGWILKLTEGTVKEYMNRIFHKTGATNRVELAVRAVNANLLNQPLPPLAETLIIDGVVPPTPMTMLDMLGVGPEAPACE